MWISGGEHDISENIVHLVLSRTEGAPAGIKGLSLFVVPKYLVGDDGALGERNDIELVGLNHKMGYRGTVNTVLSFGAGYTTPAGRPGAVGYLVGEEGAGLAYMFHMMNEARIGVGGGAAAIGYAGYRCALAYAKERVQGRLAWDKDPAAQPVPIVEHPDVRRMLLQAKAYVEGALALVLYAARLDDDLRSATDDRSQAEAGLLLDVLTPIVKSWPSTYGLVANDLAIQVLGGYGYSRDYPVEQLYRDQRLNPIHEGTHGIQALDLLGRKLIMKQGAGLHLLLGRIAATTALAREQYPEYADALDGAARAVGTSHGAALAGRRPGDRPAGGRNLPGRCRAHRGRLDLAGSAPRIGRPRRRLRRRQARRGTLLLLLRAAGRVGSPADHGRTGRLLLDLDPACL